MAVDPLIAREPAGMGHTLQMAHLLRHQLEIGLAVTRGNEDYVMDLLRRTDTPDWQAAEGQEGERRRTWDASQRAVLAAMLDPRSHTHVTVDVGLPLDAARMPYIGILPMDTTEAEDTATTGDVFYVRDRQTRMDQDEADETTWAPVERTMFKGIDERTTLHIEVWSEAMDRSLLLAELVRMVLWHLKMRLHALGIRDYATTITGYFREEPRLHPRVVHVPVIQLSPIWMRQLRFLQRVPTGYTSSGSFSA